MNLSGPLRSILLVVAGASMVAGFSGGLARLGLVPALATSAEHHGALMICGFFGTLISLERAVAQDGRAALAVPALAGCGSVLLAAGFTEPAAAAFLLSGLGLLAMTAAATWRLPTLFTVVMTVGAALWPLGTFWWMAGAAVSEVAYVWLGFLILTITAERIELSRLSMPGIVSRAALVTIMALFVAALAMGQPWTGSRLLAASLGALALWLACSDIAVRTVRIGGQARFCAVCLLLGYGWLSVAAGTLLWWPPADTPFGHDAAIHAIGLGFVLSMVFAHAPIILPAVARVGVRYVPALYGPTAMLQAAVAIRIGGDVAQSYGLIAASAWLAITSLAAYIATLASTSVRRSRFRLP